MNRSLLFTLLSFRRYFLQNSKCTTLLNQSCIDDLNLNELLNNPFLVSADGFDRNCNTFNDLSDRLCIPNTTEDVDVKVFILMF